MHTHSLIQFIAYSDIVFFYQIKVCMKEFLLFFWYEEVILLLLSRYTLYIRRKLGTKLKPIILSLSYNLSTHFIRDIIRIFALVNLQYDTLYFIGGCENYIIGFISCCCCFFLLFNKFQRFKVNYTVENFLCCCQINYTCWFQKWFDFLRRK